MFDFLRKSPFTLRITWQDKQFDALALSSFIARQRQQNYADIPHLTVEIWPPHSDRPIDVYWIYEHLRLLREDLRIVPRISKLDLVFLENDIATWFNDDGKCSKWLEDIDESLTATAEEPFSTDISFMLRLFHRLTNVTTARIRFPDSISSTFTSDEQYQELRDYAQKTEGIMMGTIAPPKFELTKDDLWLQNYRLQDNLPEDYIDGGESRLKLATARMARKRLKTITKRRKMDEFEYEEFIEIWPHFEVLHEYFEEDGAFNERDYVTSVDDYFLYGR